MQSSGQGLGTVNSLECELFGNQEAEILGMSCGTFMSSFAISREWGRSIEVPIQISVQYVSLESCLAVKAISSGCLRSADVMVDVDDICCQASYSPQSTLQLQATELFG